VTTSTILSWTGTGIFTFVDAATLVMGSTTGTKIGTATSQKLGFWNATPIVQPANTVAIDDVLVNTGLRASGGSANFTLNITGAAGMDNTIIGATTPAIATFGSTSTTVAPLIAQNTAVGALASSVLLATFKRGVAGQNAQVGYAGRILVQLRSSSLNSRDAAYIDTIWNVPTETGAISDLVLSAVYNPSNTPAAREGLRIRGGVSATQVGAFGVAPVAQPATAGTTTGFTAGGGTTVTDASTFTGGTGSTAYRISDIVLALKQLGWMAA
jgi:hypothetical protein